MEERPPGRSVRVEIKRTQRGHLRRLTGDGMALVSVG